MFEKELFISGYNNEWILDIGTYFWILNDINLELFELIKNSGNDPEEVEQRFFNIAVQINRIIPLKNQKLCKTDGILLLKKYFNFLENDYNKLFNENKETLNKMKEIRNKYDHEPHNIYWSEYLGNLTEKQINFVYKKFSHYNELDEQTKMGINLGIIKTHWTIKTDLIIKIVIQLNNIFLKIQHQFVEHFDKYPDNKEHPYVVKISNIDFKTFNNKLVKK